MRCGMPRSCAVGRLVTVCLLVLPAAAQAQEEPGPVLLEAGLVGGNSTACPGHYVAIEGRVVGPASAYAMVEPYQCTEVPKTSSRFGASVLLGRSSWLVRPALRGGMDYADGNVSPTVGANLTLGRGYGARLIVEGWKLPEGDTLVLLQIGGYVSF